VQQAAVLRHEGRVRVPQPGQREPAPLAPEEF
jgi:hypothetical protein